MADLLLDHLADQDQMLADFCEYLETVTRVEANPLEFADALAVLGLRLAVDRLGVSRALHRVIEQGLAE